MGRSAYPSGGWVDGLRQPATVVRSCLPGRETRRGGLAAERCQEYKQDFCYLSYLEQRLSDRVRVGEGSGRQPVSRSRRSFLSGSWRNVFICKPSLGFFLYTYMSMASLASYNSLFLVYVAIFALSLYAFILSQKC